MKRWFSLFPFTFMGLFAVCRVVDTVKGQLDNRTSTIVSICVALVMSVVFTFILVRLKTVK